MISNSTAVAQMLSILEKEGIEAKNITEEQAEAGEFGVFEIKNYAADLEPCQPSAADWFDDRRHSKCKKHRREARGWR